jgi:oligoribonuclease
MAQDLVTSKEAVPRTGVAEGAANGVAVNESGSSPQAPTSSPGTEAAAKEAPPLIWIDLEMTGLEPETCRILEIATIITDGQLQELAVGPDLVIHQPGEILDAMNAWCVRQHGESGLTKAVRESTLSLEAAEEQTLVFLAQHTKPGASPLCGNSVGQDRKFIERYMPKLANFLHYRTVDVSSIKELVKRWYPPLPVFTKNGNHRSLEDIRDSIAELRFYREHVFK